ncbi:NmrA family NAD(P)-binding protein [Gordonia sp. NPDC003425]
MTTYALTGATGHLGGATVDALIEKGIAPTDIVAIVRDADKASALAAAGVAVRVADYENPAALRSALAGVDRLLLVSSSAVGARVSQHTNVIEAAKAAGVGVIAYTSILRADTSTLALATEHVDTEKLLADAGIPYVLLRNGWYWENYLGGAQAAVTSGVLYGSAGDGRVAGATRADYAAAAATALVDARGGEVYELNGSEHLTHADFAATFAEVSGSPVRYQDLPEADYAAALASTGIPEAFAKILADSDAGVARGELDSDSTDLADLIGRPPTSFAEVARTAFEPAAT